MKSSDMELLRYDMVEKQLRRRGIHDERVLCAMSEVQRELFVPPDMVYHAYEDRALSIEEGQTISQPWIVAYMTQELMLRSSDRVLEIGTGSGYQAAVLSRMVKEVYSIERLGILTEKVNELYNKLGYKNICLFIGDGTEGLKEFSPFDAIIITAASPLIPQPLTEQLNEGGRMILPLAHEYDYCEVLMLITRTGEGFERKKLVECRFVPLIGKYGYNNK